MKHIKKVTLIMFVLILGISSAQHVFATENNTINAIAADDSIETAFTDQNLLNYIRKQLKLTESQPVTEANIKKLTFIQYTRDTGNEVTYLAGLEYATELTFVMFDHHHIDDLEPLRNLSKLKTLRISNNKTGLKNFNVIGDLEKLDNISFGNTPLNDADVQVIAQRTETRHIDLTNTGISDISFLTGLSKLNTVYLGANKIKDISSLAGKSLQNLWLDDNLIEDITSLKGNQYRNGLYLDNNRISDISALDPQTSPLLSIILHNNRIMNVGNITPSDVLESKARWQSGSIDIGRVDFASTEVIVDNPLVGFNGYGVVTPILKTAHDTGAFAFDAVKNQFTLDLTKVTPILDSVTGKYMLQLAWDQMDSLDTDIRFQGEFILYMEPIERFTVTYTDGVDDAVIFDDQVVSVLSGAKTPEFTGNTTREGYTFIGWSPKVEETVSANVIYVAQWEKENDPTKPIKPVNPVQPEKPQKPEVSDKKDVPTLPNTGMTQRHTGFYVAALGGLVLVLALLVKEKNRQAQR